MRAALFLTSFQACKEIYTGCSEKKYNAQNRYSILTNDDTGMKLRPIDR